MRMRRCSILLVLLALVALALVPAAAQAQQGAAAPAGADGNGVYPYWIVSEVAYGHGSVSPAGWQGVAAGATPTYYFYPDIGYHVEDVRVDGHCVHFTHWDTYTFPPVSGNHTLSVGFAKNDYVITPSAGPHGWVFPATPQVVRAGSTPSFRFMPERGYYAFGLFVDRTPVMFTAPNLYVFPPVYWDHWLHVTFMPTPAPAPLPKFTITPTVAGGQGAISPPTVQTVTKGATPTFVFLPLVGWHVGTVTVDGVIVNTTGNTYTFPAVTANHTIAVTFVQDMLTITASVNGSGGTISPSGAQSFPFGSTPTFTFTPDPGYKVGTILVDGAAVSMSAPNQYTFSTLVANHTISVSFTPDSSGPVAGAMTVAAPYSASVKKGKTAALKYSVDQAILGGTADVTITIKNAAGAVVNTQIRSGVPMNTLNTCKFRCKLARGTYTFTVSAHSDVATASNTASNTLTVR